MSGPPAPALSREIGLGLVAFALATAAAGFALSRLEPPEARLPGAARRTAPVLLAALDLVWDRPEARAALAGRLADHLAVSVELRDLAGAAVAAHPRGACARWDAAPIGRPRRGEIRVCADDLHATGRWASRAALLLAAGLLAGGIAIAVARRLTRPLRALTSAAERATRGELGVVVPAAAHALRETALVARAFDEMQIAMAGRVRQTQVLLGLAGHELRAPVARLQVLAALIADGVEPDRAAAELAIELEHLGALVEELVAAARVELGGVVIERAAVLPFVQRGCERLVARAAPGEPAAVAVDVDPALAVAGDAGLLARAIAIVVENALGHGAPPVAVAAARRGDDIEITVDDAGPGIPASRRAEALEPLWRARRGAGDPARAGGAGLGLGLSLVRDIARAHRGSVHITDSPAGGARIVLTLPAAGPSAAAR